MADASRNTACIKGKQMLKQRISFFIAVSLLLPFLFYGNISADAKEMSSHLNSEANSREFGSSGLNTEPEPAVHLISEEKTNQVSLYERRIKNEDGSYTLELYGYPVKYITPDGSVKDISVIPVPCGSGFKTGDHYFDVFFPERINEGVTLKTPSSEITMTPVSNSGAPVLSGEAMLGSGEKIVYAVDRDISIEYNITYTGLKENVVLSRYTGQSEFYYRINTGGLKLSFEEQAASGNKMFYEPGLVLSDSSGKVIARIGDILITSADGQNNISGSITYTTAAEWSEYIIKVIVPEEYLTDPQTQYPVYIDPSITVAYDDNDSTTWDDIEDITLNQNAATDSPSSGTLYVGRAGMDYGAMRSVIRFPELELYGIGRDNITSATLYLRDLMCYSYVLQVDVYGYDGAIPASAFTVSNMTWSGVNNSVQNYESSGRYRCSQNVSYNNGYGSGHVYGFSILPVVKDWAEGRNNNTLTRKEQAVILKATDAYEASTNQHYVCFGSFNRTVHKPYLTIVYTETPVEPDTPPVIEPVLSGGVYTIRNIGIMNTARSISYLSESGYGVELSYPPDITSMNNDDGDVIVTDMDPAAREKLWLIQNIPGTECYTIVPISKTTIVYSGTEIGLIGGYLDHDTEVIIDNIGNENGVFSYGRWSISRSGQTGYRICTIQKRNQ